MSTIVPFRQNKGQLTSNRVTIDYEIGEAKKWFFLNPIGLLDSIPQASLTSPPQASSPNQQGYWLSQYMNMNVNFKKK